MLSLSESIEEKYYDKKRSFELNPNMYDNKLNMNDLIEIIDDVCSSNDSNHTDFNMMFDKKLNKLMYLEDNGTWKTCLVDKGLNLIVAKIKDNFLDYYECYVIRKIRDEVDNAELRNTLKEYYKFLSVFETEPIVKDTDDSVILENNDMNIYSCMDEFYPYYNEMKNELKVSERTRIRNVTINVIKTNTNTNEERLSLDICNIFSNEAEEFQQFLHSKRC
jgi:hypothetical protein